MTQAELPGRNASASEAALLDSLRAGDEAAFEGIVARHYATMLAVAMTYVKGRATAEEVVHETRSVPFASLGPEEPAVAPERFRDRGESYPGHWRAFPRDWSASAASAVQDRETLRVVMGAIAALPPAQQTVIRMRDVEGFSPGEVCTALDVSEGNQRVLLHRARSRVRAALEDHLDA